MKQTACLVLVCLAALSALSNGLIINCSLTAVTATGKTGSIEYAHVPGVKHSHALSGHSCGETSVETSGCEHEVSCCVDVPLLAEYFLQADVLSADDLISITVVAYCLPDNNHVYQFTHNDIRSPSFTLRERQKNNSDSLLVHIASTVLLI